jgi:hypothetical protein
VRANRPAGPTPKGFRIPARGWLGQQGPTLGTRLAFHFALLVDALDQGNYTNDWRRLVVTAFLEFKQKVAEARLHHRDSPTHESLPHHERFGRLLSGSGSDTAELIRLRHAFMLSEIYPKLTVVSRDPNRGFDSLEREVIWNRDRGQCQNPQCPREGRRVAFGEATIHHILEHSAGGQTTLRNGVLICPECHSNRAAMQQLAQHFQGYIARMYDGTQVPPGNLPLDEQTPEREGEDDRNGRQGIKIEVDWGALDIDLPRQSIRKANDAETIVELLKLLLDTFGKSMRDQLLELPIVRFPLSTKPTTDFMIRSQNRPYSYTLIPGTDLYFCPQSSRSQKIERLGALFSQLTLPDGSEFPEDCVTISIEGTE